MSSKSAKKKTEKSPKKTKKKATKKKATKKKATKKKATKKKPTTKKTTKKKPTTKKTTKKKPATKKTTKKKPATKKTTKKKPATKKTTKKKPATKKTTKKKPATKIKTAGKISSTKLAFSKTKAKKNSNIYLFASETSQVVVQTRPSLIIHAIVPPTTRNLTADTYGKITSNSCKFKLKTPTLIWSQIFNNWKQQHRNNFCYCMKCNEVHRKTFVFYLHTIDLKKSKKGYIRAASYNVGNCDSSWVCFGGNQAKSLRHGNHTYWTSVFNNSPGKYTLRGNTSKDVNKSLVKKMQKYKPGDRTNTDTSNIEFCNKYDYIFGKQYMSSVKKTTGVLISFDPQLIKDNPKGVSSNADRALAGCSIVKAVIGLANYVDGSWLVDLPNGDTIALSGNQVVVQ
jgi:hypothetical protein